MTQLFCWLYLDEKKPQTVCVVLWPPLDFLGLSFGGGTGIELKIQVSVNHSINDRNYQPYRHKYRQLLVAALQYHT